MTARSTLSVRKAADILGISNNASINEIRSRYHEMVKQWHPDVSPHDPEQTHAMMIRINDAYNVLITYCTNYEFSFRPEDIRKTTDSGSLDLWMEQYGDDPIWGPRQRSPSHQD